MEKSRKAKDHDDIFDKLKEAVVNEAMNRLENNIDDMIDI